jgi:O-antigen ligase
MFQIPASPIPITSDRVLWAVVMVQLAVLWRMGRVEPARIGRTDWLLLAFIGVLTLTVLMNDWTVNHNLPISRLVFYYLMPLGLYWVGREAKITERGARTMYALLGVVGLYVAILAIAETRGPTALVFPRYIAATDNLEFLGRARGPLMNPAANGFLLGMCMAGGLMAWPRAHRGGQSLLVLYAAIVCFGIFSTLTRSAWMGGALGVFLLIFLVLPGMYRPWLIAAAVLGAAVLTVGQWENILAFKRDKNLSAQETANSAQLRPILAAIAWEMFCDRPMLGCGLAHYTDQHIYYTGDRSTELPLEQGRGYVQHNIWLSLLTETGLIGMSLFAAVVVSWILSAWRLWQARGSPLWMRQQGLVFLALAVNFLMQGLFHDMTIMLMMHMILFFMAGVTVNLQARSEEKG